MILALDTSLGAVSACVLDADGQETLASVCIKMARGHAEALVPALDSLLREVDGGMTGLRRVAVTVGPGSFTGVRVGVAAARAIGLARRIDVVGVSTLAAFAAPLLGEAGTVVVSAVEMREGRVTAEVSDEGGRRLFLGEALPRDLVTRFGGAPMRLAGSAAQRLAVEAWSRGLEADIVGETDCPDVVFVGKLGLLADPSEAPPRPLYMTPEAKGGVDHGRIAV